MIIRDLDINRVTFGGQNIRPFGQGLAQLPAKAYPPLVVDSDAVLTAPIPTQRFELVGWKRAQIDKSVCLIQIGETTLSLPFEGLEFFNSFADTKTSRPSISITLYHT